ncbi:MAG TPA: hypothetical protein VMX76_00515 [Nevskiaceae bacterium]|nr:hypothetical protein [Nevskiaceae bacterium]
MTAIERKGNQNSPSPSKRMTESWQMMVESDEVQIYMKMGQKSIEKCSQEAYSKGCFHTCYYLLALEDYLKFIGVLQ